MFGLVEAAGSDLFERGFQTKKSLSFSAKVPSTDFSASLGHGADGLDVAVSARHEILPKKAYAEVAVAPTGEFTLKGSVRDIGLVGLSHRIAWSPGNRPIVGAMYSRGVFALDVEGVPFSWGKVCTMVGKELSSGLRMSALVETRVEKGKCPVGCGKAGFEFALPNHFSFAGVFQECGRRAMFTLTRSHKTASGSTVTTGFRLNRVVSAPPTPAAAPAEGQPPMLALAPPALRPISLALAASLSSPSHTFKGRIDSEGAVALHMQHRFFEHVSVGTSAVWPPLLGLLAKGGCACASLRPAVGLTLGFND